MTFLNKVKAANAVASVAILAAVFACIWHLPDAEREDFKKARRIINGTDKAREIAEYAVVFQEGLLRAGWR